MVRLFLSAECWALGMKHAIYTTNQEVSKQFLDGNLATDIGEGRNHKGHEVSQRAFFNSFFLTCPFGYFGV